MRLRAKASYSAALVLSVVLASAMAVSRAAGQTGPNSADAHVDDFDGVLHESMSIFALVRLMKQAPDFSQAGVGEFARRYRDLVFVALPDKAQVAVAHEVEMRGVQMIGGELLAKLALHA